VLQLAGSSQRKQRYSDLGFLSIIVVTFTRRVKEHSSDPSKILVFTRKNILFSLLVNRINQLELHTKPYVE